MQTLKIINLNKLTDAPIILVGKNLTSWFNTIKLMWYVTSTYGPCYNEETSELYDVVVISKKHGPVLGLLLDEPPDEEIIGDYQPA